MVCLRVRVKIFNSTLYARPASNVNFLCTHKRCYEPHVISVTLCVGATVPVWRLALQFVLTIPSHLALAHSWGWDPFSIRVLSGAQESSWCENTTLRG